MDNKYLTMNEIAKIVNISYKTVRTKFKKMKYNHIKKK